MMLASKKGKEDTAMGDKVANKKKAKKKGKK